MADPNALERLHDAAALWSAGLGDNREIVLAACDALADGLDGYALAMLAGLPLRECTAGDVGEFLEAALGDVGVRYYAPESRGADEAVLAVMARRTLAGALSPRSLASFAHRVFGHDRLPLAERLAALDDDYDAIGFVFTNTEELDADVVAEARRIVDRVAERG